MIVKTVSLGDLAEIGSSKRIFYSEYTSTGVPFYRSKEIIEKAKGNPQLSTELFISEDKFSKIKAKFGVPEPGDLLLTSVGTLGIPYVVKPGDKFYFKDGNLTWFRNFKPEIDVRFLTYWLTSVMGKNELESHTIGSTQKAFTIQGLKKVKIQLPDIEIQKKVATITGAIDKKIELNRQMNETLEQIGRSLFANAIMISSTQKRLEDISDVVIGRTPPRKEKKWFTESPEGVKWISIKDMGLSGTFIWSTSENLTNAAIEKFRIPVIPRHTVILSFKLTVGRLAITQDDMASNEAIAQMKIKNSQIDQNVLYLALKNINYSNLGSTSSIATAVNTKTLRSMEVTLPKGVALNALQQELVSIFGSIENNTEQINSLVQLRNSLLPKLISGEIKL